MANEDKRTDTSDNEPRRSPEVDAAEAAKFRAEALKAEAEAEKTQIELKSAAMRFRQEELTLARSEMDFKEYERRHREKMAYDTYNQRYFFTDPVFGESVGQCISQLTIWQRLDRDKPKDQKAPIEIVFNSPGGSVIAGMALFDYIQSIRAAGHLVTTSTLGYAASMAGILLQAGDKRVMGRESYLMIHEVATWAMGKVGDIEDEMAFLKKMSGRILQIFADRAMPINPKTTVKFLDDHWKRRDWWIDSTEALKLGLVDEVR